MAARKKTTTTETAARPKRSPKFVASSGGTVTASHQRTWFTVGQEPVELPDELAERLLASGKITTV